MKKKYKCIIKTHRYALEVVKLAKNDLGEPDTHKT